jgi:hypothetical protein
MTSPQHRGATRTRSRGGVPGTASATTARLCRVRVHGQDQLRNGRIGDPLQDGGSSEECNDSESG